MNIVRDAPLFLAYVAYPLVAIVWRLLGFELPRNWIDVFWVAVGGVAVAVVMGRGRVRLPRRLGAALLVLLLVSTILLPLRFMVPLIGQSVNLIPLLMELKPIFYVSIGMLWLAAFGSLTLAQYIRAGAWLGALIIASFVLESYLAGKIVRPRGSGEINYDATLLLISLSSVLSSHSSRPSRVVWIILGLLATLSRTTLATAVVLVFLFGRHALSKKIVFAAGCTALIIASFRLRDLALSLGGMDRYWMWATAIDLLLRHPRESLVGFSVGVPLPLEIPPMLAWLWSYQQDVWGLAGVYAFNLHAFWLRLAITWGVPLTVLVVLALVVIAVRRRNSVLVKSLSSLVLLQGITMGLLYLSNVAVPLILAFSAGGHRVSEMGDATRRRGPAS